MALLLVGDQPSAEDVVQEAFLGLFRGLGPLNDPSRAVAYLRVSVLNGCRSVLPARKRARLRGAATDYPAVWSADVTSFQACTTQLYRFAIGPSGRPSRLTPPIADSQAGFIGRVHATSIRRAGGAIVGVVASSPDSSHAAARALEAEDVFGTAEDLITDPRVDVVHICTPNAAHAGLAQLAISAGKHVVCEKPLATSAEDAAALLSAAERAGVVGAVPFVYRFHAMVREARTLVLGGSLGRSGSYMAPTCRTG